MYPELSFYINGVFYGGEDRPGQSVHNPANLELLGHLPWTTSAEIDMALNAAERAFQEWRTSSPMDRSAILRRAATLARERAESIGYGITLDNGKPLAEAVGEVVNAAEHIEWHAEECRRIYGRVVPSRNPAVRQLVVREPAGVVAAFSPWNFPFGQAIKKVVAAIGAGCAVVLKGPEESPSAIVAMAQLFHDAGLPPGVFNIVWGIPSDVSRQLIESPLTRVVSFTGSVPVGRQLAALAGSHLKRTTMELGGHAPVLVFDDADVDQAAILLARMKTRNAGQVCVSPSRFFVQSRIYERFASRFAQALGEIKVGSGLDPDMQMGPLINRRRLEAISSLVNDALKTGAKRLTGSQMQGERGYFMAPTLLVNVPSGARVMNEEPFGPVAALACFDTVEDALRLGNALPFGLAAYVFTSSLQISARVSSSIEAGMVNINHSGMAHPELPFGGVKDSGFGSEGGTESFDSFLVTKMITQI